MLGMEYLMSMVSWWIRLINSFGHCKWDVIFNEKKYENWMYWFGIEFAIKSGWGDVNDVIEYILNVILDEHWKL